jgi:hypothetical protein
VKSKWIVFTGACWTGSMITNDKLSIIAMVFSASIEVFVYHPFIYCCEYFGKIIEGSTTIILGLCCPLTSMQTCFVIECVSVCIGLNRTEKNYELGQSSRKAHFLKSLPSACKNADLIDNRMYECLQRTKSDG